jgi:hypothetical protein
MKGATGADNRGLFTLWNGFKLTLGENITLDGEKGKQNKTGELLIGNYTGTSTSSGVTAPRPMIYLFKGHLVMETGSKITGVVNKSGIYGSAQGVIQTSENSGMNGSVTLAGGEISDNEFLVDSFQTYAAVSMQGNAVFTMTGGAIKDNVMREGLYANSTGNITISGGEISGHIDESGKGYGIYINQGRSATMTGGTISGNSVGVYCGQEAKFTMTRGTISGNRREGAPYSLGVGVYETKKAEFTINGPVDISDTVMIAAQVEYPNNTFGVIKLGVNFEPNPIAPITIDVVADKLSETWGAGFAIIKKAANNQPAITQTMLDGFIGGKAFDVKWPNGTEQTGTLNLTMKSGEGFAQWLSN